MYRARDLRMGRWREAAEIAMVKTASDAWRDEIAFDWIQRRPIIRIRDTRLVGAGLGVRTTCTRVSEEPNIGSTDLIASRTCVSEDEEFWNGATCVIKVGELGPTHDPCGVVDRVWPRSNSVSVLGVLWLVGYPSMASRGCA